MLKSWATRPRGVRWLAGIAVIFVAMAIVWALFVPAADWLARHDVGSAKGALLQTARDAARGRLLTLAAGLFAVGALVYTARNFGLSRQGQVTDRYTKAIEQLGSDKLDMRIGGIYALERVARDSARDHPAVMDVLTAFIREHSDEPWTPPADDEPDADIPGLGARGDIQAAVTVIGRRNPRHDQERRLVLYHANLSRADISRADLGGAYLVRAWLVRADLQLAKLQMAIAYRADLTGANLTSANLIRANLQMAILTRADLTRADLTRADLTRADLTGADLTGADLTGADFTGADLTGARWPGDASVPEGWREAPDGRLVARIGPGRGRRP